jgi:hypothetical protein
MTSMQVSSEGDMRTYGTGTAHGGRCPVRSFPDEATRPAVLSVRDR